MTEEEEMIEELNREILHEFQDIAFETHDDSGKATITKEKYPLTWQLLKERGKIPKKVRKMSYKNPVVEDREYCEKYDTHTFIMHSSHKYMQCFYCGKKRELEK